MSKTFFISLIAVAMLAAAPITAAHAERTVGSSNLFQGLWGFGRTTTGGLGGYVYVVRRTDDGGGEGTLRYAIENPRRPVWIVFDAATFPATTKTTINLESSLSFNETHSVTIDGRGSYVSLKRTIASCTDSAGDDNVVYIRSSTNIIMTHLDFAREYPANATTLDKEACGDIIAIDNDEDYIGVKYFDRIWINQSNFYDCGDGCLDITHLSTLTKAFMTISRNSFVGVRSEHEKGLLVGKDSEFDPGPGYGVALSLYQNRFYNLRSRLPRIAHGYLRAYNNVFENWYNHAIAASVDTRVMIEQNVFRSTDSTKKATGWVELGNDNNSIWARRNIWWTYGSASQCPSPPGGSGIGSCTTSSFPACSVLGGPWYYDCSERMFNVAGMSYASGLSFLRSLAGWKPAANDVRDTP
jgi:pectate lyase